MPGASIRQAMALIGISRPVLEGLIQQGKLTAVQLGPHRRITLASIDRFLGELGKLENPSPQAPLFMRDAPTVRPEPPAPAQSERRPRKVTVRALSEDRPANRRGRPPKAARVAAE